MNKYLKKIDFNDPLVAAATTGLGLALFYYLFLRKNGSTTLTNAQIESQQVSQQQTPTYSQTQYQVFADKIYQAGVAWFGTDEVAIYSVFQAMKNDLDILKLINAFGSRRLEFSTVMGNLAEFLYSEFDNKEITKLNSILAAQGIKYQF